MSAPLPLDTLLQVAVDSMDDAVFVTEGDYVPVRRIVYVNRAFTQMTGYSGDDVLGKTPDVTVGKDTDPAALARIQTARSAKVPIVEELLKYRKDGTPFWARVNVVPVPDAQHNSSFYVCVMRDITERKHLFARVLAEGRMAPLGWVVAHAAHDMARNVSAAAIQLRHAASRVHSAELADVIGAVARNAEEIRRVIFDVSLFARDEEALPASADVREILAACENLALARARGRIRVVREIDDVPHILGDRTRVGQALLNVLINATQAIPEGKPGRITLRVRLLGGHVHVAISDDGIGISEPDLAKIFTPFFTTKGVRMGRGMGLFISRHIVTSLGGRLKVRSAPGEGTTVEVEFRVASGARISDLPRSS